MEKSSSQEPEQAPRAVQQDSANNDTTDEIPLDGAAGWFQVLVAQ